MGRSIAVYVLGLLVGAAIGRLDAQDSPIQRGSLQIAGSAQLTHTRDIGNDRGWTTFEVTPRVGYFVANGLAVNANLRFRHVAQGNQGNTEWGVGPGLTYYVNIKSRHFYPFLSGRTLFTWEHERPGLSGNAFTYTNRVWLVSGGGLVMLGRHVGISGELFYQHERFTAESSVQPQLVNSSETYGLQWGVAAFLF